MLHLSVIRIFWIFFSLKKIKKAKFNGKEEKESFICVRVG